MFRFILRSLTTNQNIPRIVLPQLKSSDDIQFSFIKHVCSKINTSAHVHENKLDSDEYIFPLGSETEVAKFNISSKEDLKYALRTKFKLGEPHIGKVLEVIKNDQQTFNNVERVMQILAGHKVNKESIIQSPWILNVNAQVLQKKLVILQQLPIRDMNDFLPFLKLSIPRLSRLVTVLINEASGKGRVNRIYFISDKLGLEPFVVSKYLSKRLFMLEMPFGMLCENLDIMIHYGVAPLNILRDLWAFRYTPQAVKARLERAKIAKKEKIMPWMVRCPESILQRSLKLALDERKLLGESSVVDYVSQRLGYDPETTQAIMNKHPAALRVRVTKIKEILDYLLNDAGFTTSEIAQVPRILCHSLETTKKRIEELASLGCRPSSLVIVCRSQREYDKFIREWNEVRSHIKENK